MPVKLRSSVRPKASKTTPIPIKPEIKQKSFKMIVSENYTRDRDLLIVTDSETEYESEVETPKPASTRLPRKVNLKREFDQNMNEEPIAKRVKITESAKATKLETESIKPKRPTKSTTRRRKVLTRAEKRREADLEKAKRQMKLELAAQQLFDLNSTVDFMDIVNL